MKILLCSPYLDSPSVISGGINQWGRYIVSYYNEYGKKDVELIPSSFDRYIYLSGGNVPIWKRIWSGINEQGSAVKKATLLMREEKPDVVHICTSAGLGLIKDLRLIEVAHKIGAKTVVHLHFGRTPELLRKNNWEAVLLKKVLSSSDMLLAMNEPTMVSLLANGYSRVQYLPNPLSLSVINTATKLSGTIERSQNRILFVGHVSRAKGIYELVEACTKIPGVRLRIVGKCSTYDMENLMNIARTVNNANWIEFTGEVPHNQVLREFCGAGIFAFPSYSEGFPNVILEAMACGCPIASSNVGAIPEMLDDNGSPCGVCFEPKSTQAVMEGLMALLSDEKQKSLFAERALIRVNELYAMPKVWDKMIKIWEELV